MRIFLNSQNECKKKRCSFFLISFLIYACSGIGDSSEKLGGAYVYSDTGGDMEQIYQANLGYNNNIYPKVIDYAFDDNFILALQEPHKKAFKSVFAFDLRNRFIRYGSSVKSKNDSVAIWADDLDVSLLKGRISMDNTESDMITSEMIVDSLINANPYYQKIFASKRNYWIIVKSTDQLFGPYSREEYLNKRNELKIPEELEME
jgi:hypothetical protein